MTTFFSGVSFPLPPGASRTLYYTATSVLGTGTYALSLSFSEYVDGTGVSYPGGASANIQPR